MTWETGRMLPTIAILGPTASGKSRLAVDLAVELTAARRPAEIVNADSMLVYRGMDIGTAKPTSGERRGISHHLIDILDVTQTASVADFQRLARDAVAQCLADDVIPIVVGGSALYLRAILDEFDFPGTDPTVRARLEQDLADVGADAMHARLRAQAPEAAALILPGNGRRIVRALEVVELTGSYTAQLPAHTYALKGVVALGLELERAEMDRRIDDRVEAMWKAGLVDEVRRLIPQGLREGQTSSRGLGYQQVLSFLGGDITEDEAKEQTKAGTRRFARKQLGWWRNDPRIAWLPADPSPAVADVVSRIDSLAEPGEDLVG